MHLDLLYTRAPVYSNAQHCGLTLIRACLFVIRLYQRHEHRADAAPRWVWLFSGWRGFSRDLLPQRTEGEHSARHVLNTQDICLICLCSHASMFYLMCVLASAWGSAIFIFIATYFCPGMSSSRCAYHIHPNEFREKCVMHVICMWTEQTAVLF